jgi:hypothetical protein
MKWCFVNQKTSLSKTYTSKLGANGMSSEVKDRIVTLYIKGCLNYHAYIYFKWRIYHNSEARKDTKLLEIINIKKKKAD